MNSIKKTARMAGFLYLIYIVTTIFADVFGRSQAYCIRRCRSNSP